MDLDNSKDDDALITGLTLYQLWEEDDGDVYMHSPFHPQEKKKEIEKIKFAKPINLNLESLDDHFDYVKFWKERYKKLQGIQ